ncbi:hypothetical protein Taro_007349 [Colocasia esculenta]|uniref:ABC transporter C family member 8 n=1 Tax=Colocasia esculenta TaxID=4460 RepID=A0A843TZH9_COLES|nr:hypothetical protein [Colocasia esculenta]
MGFCKVKLSFTIVFDGVGDGRLLLDVPDEVLSFVILLLSLVPDPSLGINWVCDGGFHLGSSCTQRSLLDAFNVAFLLGYSLTLLVSRLAKRGINGSGVTLDRVFCASSVLCAGIGIAHIGAGFWPFLSGSHGILYWAPWWIYLLRGVVWIAIAVSVCIHGTRWLRTLVITWWVSSSALLSALNVRILVEERKLHVLDVAAWLASLLLLFCALKLTRSPTHQHSASNRGLSEPLLNGGGGEERKTELTRAGFFSKLTFSWLNPLLRLGRSKPLGLDDIPCLDAEDDALLAYQVFSCEWDLLRRDGSRTKNLVLFSLARCYWKEMTVVGVYALLKTASFVVLPLVLYAFVEYSGREKKDLRTGSLLLLSLAVNKGVESLSQRHWFFDARRFGMRMRSAVMAAVFRKQLKLSSLGRRNHSTGEVVNYIAVDAYRLGEFPWWFHMGWSMPLQLLCAVTILLCTMGTGALPGLVPLLICGFLNVPFARSLKNSQLRFMAGQDQRLRATSEVLNNMKIIKLQSWEDKFRKMIGELRDEEFRWLADIQINKSYGTALYWMSPVFISAVIFAGVAIIGSAPLNASTIFTVLVTLRVMSEPVRMLPEALSILIQVKVSLDRLDRFLLEDEIKAEDVQRSPVHSSDVRVRISKGFFRWDPNMASPTLSGLNLQVFRGQKIAVCGHVGAGKSSLLHAILGEIPRVSGTVEIFGSVAYVSQIAWIQSGTIRDNILYGKAMEKSRYEMAIRSCALDKDIDNFDHGDLTEIGQRGLNMSGGQKQRIQLARAVYSDADIYLLDDPFSAVDAHTAAVLFNDCIMATLQKKTVFLVTHQIEFLTEADKILVMVGGQISQSGSYEELLKAGTVFQQLVSAHRSAMTVLESPNHGNKEETRTVREGTQTTELKEQESVEDVSIKGISTVQLTEDEEKDMGNLGWKPYIDYVSVCSGWLLLCLVILSQFGFVILQTLSTYWLAAAMKIPHIGKGTMIGFYTILSFLSGVSVYFRGWASAHLGLKASRAFFSGLMESLFKAPMSFLDSTPVGRILTRASSDMSVLDYDTPFSISYVLAPLIEMVAAMLVMTIVTWQVLVVAIPAMIAVRYYQGYYLASAREIVRINGTTKAPVVNYAAETSLGAVTIRAFSDSKRFFHNNLKLINTDATLYFHTIAAMEWVLMRVEALQNATIITSALFLLLLPQEAVAPGFVGLTLSYSLSLSGTQVFLTRWYSNLDNYIISVERIKQYMHIPSEPPAIISDNRPPPLWPHEGRIDLQCLKVRNQTVHSSYDIRLPLIFPVVSNELFPCYCAQIKYRPNAPLVLKGLTCTFAAGHKVGVVGRTGSGKTTLISALFRLVEPFGGRILVDSLDICSIGLKDLRMNLSIIPQEPTLFRGSVRSNLDPLGQYTDQEIWEALEKCQLKTTVSSLPDLLDSSVSDEGENWSAGQRQLFCLGRILLRKNRILVLDEATASIDSATDATLQKIIGQEFRGCTVITVAHRVPTVVDSHMVMVLSYGKIVEYDNPSNLLETNSAFSKLLAEYWSNCRRSSSQNLEEH